MVATWLLVIALLVGSLLERRGSTAGPTLALIAAAGGFCLTYLGARPRHRRFVGELMATTLLLVVFLVSAGLLFYFHLAGRS